MREIKFRAWDSVNKKMLFPASFESGLGCSVPNEYMTHTDTDIFLNCRYNGVIFMEYTGLQDRHDICIYEGDIVKHWHEDMFFQDNVTGVVRWYKDDACFGIEYESCSQPLYNMDLRFAEIEVIGNVFENPGAILTGTKETPKQRR